MTFRHLTIFLQVCDSGSMTAAAKALFVAQPSVSQAIGELESHYQVKLFERLGRRLYLTEPGKRLLTYARHIVNLNQEAAAAMREVSEHGILRLGASVTVGTYLLGPLLHRLSAVKADIEVTSYVNNTSVIENDLLEDRLDLGVVEGKIQSPWLVTQNFQEDEMVLVCAPQHPWAKEKSIRAAQLEGAPFIVREAGSGTRELFEAVMTSADLNWKLAGCYNNAETIKATVAAGLGHTVISRLAVAKEAARGELAIVPVEGLSFVRTFKIVYHKNKYLSPAMQFFIDLVLRTPAAQLLPPLPATGTPTPPTAKKNAPPAKDIPIWL